VTVDPLVVQSAQDVLFAVAVGTLVCSAILGRQQQGRPAAVGRLRPDTLEPRESGRLASLDVSRHPASRPRYSTLRK
jgi:hypothetical protein